MTRHHIVEIGNFSDRRYSQSRAYIGISMIPVSWTRQARSPGWRGPWPRRHGAWERVSGAGFPKREGRNGLKTS